MGYMVLEVVPKEGSDIDELRKWSGSLIRDGDGLYMEDGRLFLVLVVKDIASPVAAISRLNPGAEAFNAEVVARAMGTDPIADSLYRRAESNILPVEPRRP